MHGTAEPTVVRCPWASGGDDVYARYHDQEWGVPQGDSRALFEKLVLEGFQSGLSWITILRKRDAFRRAFAGFHPARMAQFTDADIERLMADPGIIRNRAKIEAAIRNATAYLNLAERIPFADFVWTYANAGEPRVERRTIAEVPADTDASRALSKALKAEGFCFVGPTTAYAFMQSVGMVNDHLVACHRHAPCEEEQIVFFRAKAPV